MKVLGRKLLDRGCVPDRLAIPYSPPCSDPEPIELRVIVVNVGSTPAPPPIIQRSIISHQSLAIAVDLWSGLLLVQRHFALRGR
jgi:hypothetical protein